MSGREETNRRLRRAIEQKTAQDPVLNGFFPRYGRSRP